MSTVRAARRWMQPSVHPEVTDRRRNAVMVLLCLVIFVCFFLIGRATVPASQPREASAGPPISSVGKVVPLHLSSAPPLTAIAATATPTTPTVAKTTAASASPTAVRAASQHTGGGTSVVAKPSVPVNPAPAQAPASSTAPASGPGSSHTGSGKSPPAPAKSQGGGVSFDSSG